MAETVRLLHTSLIVVGTALASCSEQPAHKPSAIVVDIAPRVARWHADEVIVPARSGNGLTGEETVSIARLNCRVGDQVQATGRDVSLNLNGHPCER